MTRGAGALIAFLLLSTAAVWCSLYDNPWPCVPLLVAAAVAYALAVRWIGQWARRL